MINICQLTIKSTKNDNNKVSFAVNWKYKDSQKKAD